MTGLRFRTARISFYLCLACALAGCGSSIHDTVARGDMEKLEAMLTRDPAQLEARNKLGKTPLHYAVSFAQRDAMVFLVAQESDVNAQDNTGMSPLHVAARLDIPGAARLLLDSGAAIELSDDFGNTPLHEAAIHGSRRVAGLLLVNGADVRATNARNLTPREVAGAYRQPEMAQFFADAEMGPE